MTAAVASERIQSLDVLRGVAVLGILLMNIIGFGLPDAYQDPSVSGGTTGADFYVWLKTLLVFEGTMRGLFTLLFGAGVVLFTSRLEAAAVPDAADLHVRRMLWLIGFGFVNSHLLLWHGDILYEYGVVGLVLYAFRHARPRMLFTIAGVALLAISFSGSLATLDLEATRAAALETGATAEAVEAWDEELAKLKPSAAALQERVDAMRDGFASAFERVTDDIRWWRTSFFYRYGFLEDFATMLIGIALFRLGALQGQWTAAGYARMALAGYAIGLTVNAAEAYAVVRSGYDPIVLQWTWNGSYQLGRIPMTLGHLGAVLWLCTRVAIPATLRRLAAVGRMALTNYLAQSLICMLIFTGVGLGLFGQLQRHQLYYIVAAIWGVQLIVSPWWLRRHAYGPAEWLWRALTYGRRPVR